MYSGGRAARGGGEVTSVVTNLTDGCRGQAVYVGLGGASQKEALTNGGRQGPQEGILEGQQGQENPEVLIGNGSHEICQFQKSTELLIQKLSFSWLVCKIALEVGKYDLHFQGHYHMLAGSCRSIYSRSHGRC